MNLNDLKTIRASSVGSFAAPSLGSSAEGSSDLKGERTFSGSYTEKKSRFLSFLVRVNSVEEAFAFLEKTRKAHPDARHVVSAWRVLEAPDGAGNGCDQGGEAYIVEKASDDGEPSGTSGPPVLEVLDKAQLVNVCLCVVRYFGGVLLGSGGLKRAYAEAAKEAVEAALVAEAIVSYRKIFSAKVDLEYAQLETFKHLLKRYGGSVLEQKFEEKIELSFSVPAEKTGAFKNALVEKFAGSLALQNEEIAFGEVVL